MSQEAKDALQKYNVEAIQKFKASRNLNETALTHNVYENAQKGLPHSIDEEELQECQQFNADQDLEPPTDDILEFITSQGLVEFRGLPPLIPLLQCVNRLGFEICSVDSCQSEQGGLVTVI